MAVHEERASDIAQLKKKKKEECVNIYSVCVCVERKREMVIEWKTGRV